MEHQDRISVMHCKACSHPHRDVLDQQIVGGTPLRAIVAANPGLSLGGLVRHKEHIKLALTQAMESSRAESVVQATTLLERVGDVIDEAREIAMMAKGEKKFAAAAAALNTIKGCLELIGRLDGSLAQPGTPGLHLHLSKTVNITQNFGDDKELAALIGEATNGFDVSEFLRLKAIAEGTRCDTRVTPHL